MSHAQFWSAEHWYCKITSLSDWKVVGTYWLQESLLRTPLYYIVVFGALGGDMGGLSVTGGGDGDMDGGGGGDGSKPFVANT